MTYFYNKSDKAKFVNLNFVKKSIYKICISELEDRVYIILVLILKAKSCKKEK